MRPIKLALCLWLICLNLFATTQGLYWNVRPSGNDLNGGGFNSGFLNACTGGTDYSQQNGPQVTFNGTTVTATSVGAGTTIVLTGYTVATTDKCNVLNVASGVNFNTGTFDITNVNVGANSWTLSAAITTGAGSAMVGRMGGGFATVSKGVAVWNGNGGDTVWLLNSSSYTVTTAIIPAAVNPNINLGNTLQGYSATYGDSGKATITSATNSVSLISLNNTELFTTFRNLQFTHTAATRGNCVVPNNSSVKQLSIINSVFDGCATALSPSNSQPGTLLDGVEIKNSTDTTYITNSVNTFTLRNSFIHDNAGAVKFSAQFASESNIEIRNNVFKANAKCLDFTLSGSNASRITVEGNTCTNSTGDGFRFNTTDAGSSSMIFRNNIMYGNTGWGCNTNPGIGDGIHPVINDSNSYGANTAGARSGCPVGTGDVTLSADPFVNRSGNNFALNSTFGGGAALKGVGAPSSIPNAGTDIIDIGALQSGIGGSSGGGNSSYVQ